MKRRPVDQHGAREENHVMGFFGRSVEEKIRRRFILSIDGGGMRGIIPSVILSHMAELLIEMGDARPLYAHFDMIAGTSSGALTGPG